MPTQQRQIVYFLGAGASYASRAAAHVQGGGSVSVPTQAQFWGTFLRFSRPAARARIEAFLFRYFLGYERVPARLHNAAKYRKLQGVDVEEVFTFLSERIHAPGTSPQLRTYAQTVWADLLGEFGGVFARFEPNAKSRAMYRAFMRNHFRSRDRIVSFNYDTVFEDSLPRNRRWHYECLMESKNSVRILKAHGSANWQSDGGIISVVKRPSSALVVAPTHLKFVRMSASDDAQTGDDQDGVAETGYLDQSKELGEVWRRMEKAMREAKALVFIGYSFPPADLFFSSVLRSVLAARENAPTLVVVNPDAIAIARRLRDRFAATNVVRYFDFGTFTQVTRAQVLANNLEQATAE